MSKFFFSILGLVKWGGRDNRRCIAGILIAVVILLIKNLRSIAKIGLLDSGDVLGEFPY
jgi:hypothetical protein